MTHIPLAAKERHPAVTEVKMFWPEVNITICSAHLKPSESVYVYINYKLLSPLLATSPPQV